MRPAFQFRLSSNAVLLQAFFNFIHDIVAHRVRLRYYRDFHPVSRDTLVLRRILSAVPLTIFCVEVVIRYHQFESST